MSQASRRLRDEGYVESWIAEGDVLRRFTSTTTFDPKLVTVDEVVRFEGSSDPGDGAILFALSSRDGHRGQYGTAYGPETPSEDVAVIVALPQAV